MERPAQPLSAPLKCPLMPPTWTQDYVQQWQFGPLGHSYTYFGGPGTGYQREAARALPFIAWTLKPWLSSFLQDFLQDSNNLKRESLIYEVQERGPTWRSRASYTWSLKYHNYIVTTATLLIVSITSHGPPSRYSRTRYMEPNTTRSRRPPTQHKAQISSG